MDPVGTRVVASHARRRVSCSFSGNGSGRWIPSTIVDAKGHHFRRFRSGSIGGCNTNADDHRFLGTARRIVGRCLFARKPVRREQANHPVGVSDSTRLTASRSPNSLLVVHDAKAPPMRRHRVRTWIAIIWAVSPLCFGLYLALKEGLGPGRSGGNDVAYFSLEQVNGFIATEGHASVATALPDGTRLDQGPLQIAVSKGHEPTSVPSLELHARTGERETIVRLFRSRFFGPDSLDAEAVAELTDDKGEPNRLFTIAKQGQSLQLTAKFNSSSQSFKRSIVEKISVQISK
jgi:hypothetical protein